MWRWPGTSNLPLSPRTIKPRLLCRRAALRSNTESIKLLRKAFGDLKKPASQIPLISNYFFFFVIDFFVDFWTVVKCSLISYDYIFCNVFFSSILELKQNVYSSLITLFCNIFSVDFWPKMKCSLTCYYYFFNFTFFVDFWNEMIFEPNSRYLIISYLIQGQAFYGTSALSCNYLWRQYPKS